MEICNAKQFNMMSIDDHTQKPSKNVFGILAIEEKRADAHTHRDRGRDDIQQNEYKNNNEQFNKNKSINWCKEFSVQLEDPSDSSS